MRKIRQKIAVLRANALGDFIFVLPALAALRKGFPNAELVYLGAPWHKEFLAGRGVVDRVEVVPVSPGVRGGTESDENREDQEAFFTRMKQEDWDWALQLHGGGRNSNRFLLKLGAAQTAGTATPDAPRLSVTVPYIYYQNEILRWLEVVTAMGVESGEVRPRLPVLERDRIEAEKIRGLTKRYVVIHPGASDLRRRWPESKFARVGEVLRRRGFLVVLVGVESERGVVAAVEKQMREKAINLCGRLSLPGLVGLLERAAAIVGNDSGPIHLAEAIGTPAVGVFWCGNVINAGFMTRARYRPAVSWTTKCPVCGQDIAWYQRPFEPYKADCSHLVSFVAEVTVAEVAGQTLEVIGEKKYGILG